MQKMIPRLGWSNMPVKSWTPRDLRRVWDLITLNSQSTSAGPCILHAVSGNYALLASTGRMEFWDTWHHKYIYDYKNIKLSSFDVKGFSIMLSDL